MWQKKTLTPAAADVICSTIAISPWTPGAGHREDSGLYLSPDNAVAVAASRLAGAPAALDITALLFTAPTVAAFADELSTAAAVFPLQQINEVYRRANTAISLAESRMQIPARVGGLPATAPLSVSTMRAAAAAGSIVSAGSSAPGDIAAALQAFGQLRASLLAAAQQQLQQIAAGSVDVWTVSTVKNTAGAVSEMRDSVPNPDHVFALCVVFAGADLAALRGMLKDG
ncbi:TPA: hypothetical protein ACTW9B_003726 [Klebsiella michiganensis]